MSNFLPKIGITQGDPNGVSLEIIFKLFNSDYLFNYCTPILYANPRPFAFLKKTFDTPNFQYTIIDSADKAKQGVLNLVICNNDEFKVEHGISSEQAAIQALSSIDAVLEDAKNGALDAIVTGPVNKQSIAAISPNFTGHTGYIANKLEITDYCMILFAENLRVALATEHVALENVSKNLSQESLIAKINTVHYSLLNDFLITRPRIAVLALNPHAGDGGIIGKEELEIIKPAIDTVFSETKLVYGPYSADTFFASKNLAAFDAVIAMYHDQGLIPFKTLTFNEGVNFTAGLQLIRTSPDHGTAYDIAGKNCASSSSFQNAIHEAIALAKNRVLFKEEFSNPLPFNEFKRERFKINF